MAKAKLMMKTNKKASRKSRRRLSILSLPNDTLAAILASVASASIEDLVNAKLTCKWFHEAALDYQVFKGVTLEKVPIIDWNPRPQVSDFLKQCEACGNPDILYQRGLMEYFTNKRLELGRDLLKKSAESGHKEAIYALGMILFSNKASKCQAIDLLQKIHISEIEKCRSRACKILSRQWKNHKFNRLESECLTPSCRNGGMRWRPSKEEWDCGQEDFSFCTDNCKWNYEFSLFCCVFR